MTIEDAIQWIDKAEQLGYYGGNTPRLLRAATEAIKDLIGEDEPRSIEYVLGCLEKQLHARLLNKADGLSVESAKTYVQRAGRLLRDYAGWVQDPVSFSPVSRRAVTMLERKTKSSTPRGDDKARKSTSSTSVPASSVVVTPNTREHSLELSGGRAVLRLPTALTLDEVRMLSLLLASHCPEARFDWPGARLQRDENVVQTSS